MNFALMEESLRNLVNDEGIDYLSREPFEVYRYLTDEMELDKKLCRSILSVLLAGVVEETLKIQGVQSDAEGRPVLTGLSGVIEDSNQIPDDKLNRLTKWIQKECFYKKSLADDLAGMFLSLFSTENLAAWNVRTGEGFREFCDKEWKYKFHGEHTWHHGGGSEDCWVDIEMSFVVEESELFKELIKRDFTDNPFLSVEAIYDIVSDRLNELLQNDMEEYAEAETYYEPYMEDYQSNGEPVVKEFCDNYGLKLLSFECDGSESGFEPDSRW